MEPTTTGTAGVASLLAKLAAAPGTIGVVGGAMLFFFLWPKTAKEGIYRLMVAGFSSHVFGESVLRTLINFMPWLHADEIRSGAYLLAAWPAWWILGAFVKWLNSGKTPPEMVKEIKDAL